MALNHLYFDSGGHLTAKALGDLASGAPIEELARLEIAEHLSYCDKCIKAYTDLLCPQPPVDLTQLPPAQVTARRAAREGRVLFLQRCARVGFAACLTLMVWLGGLSQIDPETLPKVDMHAAGEKISDSLADFSQQISDGLDQLFDFSFERSFKS